MLTIVSVDNDAATNDVLLWMKHRAPDSELLRINTTGLFEKGETYAMTVGTAEDGQVVKNKILDKNKSWIRRFPSRIVDYPGLSGDLPPVLYGKVRYHLNDELERFFYGLLYALDPINLKENRNTYKDARTFVLNKWRCLCCADLEGLKIPPSLVATSIEQIQWFVKNEGRSICKPLSDGQTIQLDNSEIFQFVEVIHDEDIERLEGAIFPLLVQKFIPSVFEIRVYFFQGDFFPMARYKESKKSMLTDHRKEMALRSVPFKFPTEIENKLHALIDKLGFTECSMDVMMTESGEFYFLEINPLGFFGDVSELCNYYLERRVADKLISLEKDI